ncbi:LysR family transcriptional regulator [Pseudomonas oryzihabitans]|uniref:DNA-binding transcriptional LysR family regulator n=1 Tax=Pseudomonas oryzihabitans TaxID=47885 RepID=A0AAJ2EWU7_9PSED|nr:LysR family transcriptional regulator [Pseudomonas psychrotolerans]MDR6235153.1 DNA-binding transcriptional LysR family regulator [Pseudomonas psychrotolerans]MDR6355629.1 DNA-binding transcriptional LysR family regulator [Pseudomonas psychrotolerans]
MHNTLRRLDLNLLVTLDALLAELNVTRAARRLNLAQPTVSLQLGRLRQLLDDPLLLPGPRGMRPTARAEALREPLRQALAALEDALAPAAPFNPARAERTWRIAASDHSATTLLTPLLAELRQQAPGLRLALLDKKPDLLAEQLEGDRLDLALDVADAAAPGLRQRLLFTERYLLAGRRGHPALQEPVSLETFCELDQALVSPNGGGFASLTDRLLAERGLARRVVLSVPHFSTLASALLASDLVALLPARIALTHPGLQTQPPPLAVPGFDMLLLWPERLHRDPAHAWLRERIVSSLTG